MKKIFNVTIGGYYLCSLVLGLAMALTVGMFGCSLWDDVWRHFTDMEDELKAELPDGGILPGVGPYYPKGERASKEVWTDMYETEEQLYRVWNLLPMTDLYNRLCVSDRTFERHSIEGGAICLAVSAVLTVFIFVMIVEGKGWRQKFLQAVGFTLLIILLDLVYKYAMHRAAWYIEEASTLMIVVPALLLIIPFFLLKKTRQPKKQAPHMISDHIGVEWVHGEE